MRIRDQARMICLALLMATGIPIVFPTYVAKAAEARVIYACSACGFQQADNGTCPTCNTNLVKMEVSYECPTCGMVQVKPGNCSMCGTPLREKKVPAE